MNVKVMHNDGEVELGDLTPHARACRLDLSAHGCGHCHLLLSEKWRADLGVRVGQELRIYQPAERLLWRGLIRRSAKRISDNLLTVEAAGYAWRLRDLVLTAAEEQSFTNQAPEAVAQSLWNSVIQPSTNLDSFQSDSSGKTLDAYAARVGQSVWAILDRLALLAGDWMWGVDENLQLSLRNPAGFATEPLHTFDIGRDIVNLTRTDAGPLANDLTIEGSGYEGRFAHAASVAAHGRCHRTIADPGISTAAAAQLLAEGAFARWAAPATSWTVRAPAPEPALRPWTGRFAVRDPQREAKGSAVATFGSIRYQLLASRNGSPMVELHLTPHDDFPTPSPA